MLKETAQHYVPSYATCTVIHNHEFSWRLFLCVSSCKSQSASNHAKCRMCLQGICVRQQ